MSYDLCLECTVAQVRNLVLQEIAFHHRILAACPTWLPIHKIEHHSEHVPHWYPGWCVGEVISHGAWYRLDYCDLRLVLFPEDDMRPPTSKESTRTWWSLFWKMSCLPAHSYDGSRSGAVRLWCLPGPASAGKGLASPCMGQILLRRGHQNIYSSFQEVRSQIVTDPFASMWRRLNAPGEHEQAQALDSNAHCRPHTSLTAGGKGDAEKRSRRAKKYRLWGEFGGGDGRLRRPRVPPKSPA